MLIADDGDDDGGAGGEQRKPTWCRLKEDNSNDNTRVQRSILI